MGTHMVDLEKQINELPLPVPGPAVCEKIESMLGIDSGEKTVPTPTRNRARARLAFAGSLVAVGAIAFLVSLFASKTPLFADVQKKMIQVETIEYTFKKVYFKGLDSVPVRNEDFSYRQVSDIHALAKDVGETLKAKLPLERDEKKIRELANMIEIVTHHAEKGTGKLEFAFLGRISKGRMRYENFFPFDQVSIDTVNSSDAIQRMTKIPADAVQPLGTAMIDGSQSTGWRLTEQMNGGTVHRDYWVDSTTLLPTQIEHKWFAPDKDSPDEESVYSNFVYNEPIDDSLYQKEHLGPGGTWSLPQSAD